jgi:hypothetical protein
VGNLGLIEHDVQQGLVLHGKVASGEAALEQWSGRAVEQETDSTVFAFCLLKSVYNAFQNVADCGRSWISFFTPYSFRSPKNGRARRKWRNGRALRRKRGVKSCPPPDLKFSARICSNAFSHCFHFLSRGKAGSWPRV